MVLGNDVLLDHVAAKRIDGMCDIGVELGSAVGVFRGAPILQALATMVAVGGAEVILGVAVWAMSRELAARHGHERPVRAVNDLQIPHHEAVVERDRTKRLETFSRLVHELDANFGDLHGRSPCERAVLRVAARGIH